MRTRHALILTAIGLLLVGCSDDDSTNAPADTSGDSSDAQGDSPPSNTIEIFSWWTAPGEAEALQALIDVYTTANPNVSIVNVTAELGDGQDAREVMHDRIAANNPPDTFQLSPQEIVDWVAFEGDTSDTRIEPLDGLFAEEGWLSAYPEAVVQTLRYDGIIYAVPVGMHRQNALFYNTSLVDTPPTTLAELFTLCETLEGEGVTPLAISASAGWTIEIVFRSVLAASAGNQYHDDFYNGRLDLSNPASLAKLEQAVDDFLTLMDYTNANASEIAWDEAAKLVFDGDAAMYIHGDWAKGYLLSLGWEPGLDFDVAASPGTAGTFIYNVDAFSLCSDGPNPENTLNFLRVMGSAEGQGAFNRIKGSTPVHADVDISDWDAIAQSTFADYSSASILHNVNLSDFRTYDDEGDEVMLADQLFVLFGDHSQRDAFITWVVDVYADATSH